MEFRYTARSSNGETSEGQLAADSPRQARRVLRQQGLFIIALDAAAKGASARNGRGPSGWTRIRRKDLLTMTSEWAIMTKAGIDMAGALDSLARQSETPALRAVLEDVHAEVANGKPVSAALRRHEQVFGNTYIAAVAAGEASGALPDVLHRLAMMQKAEIRMRTARRALLAYPTVLAAMTALVLLGLVFFVLPRFSEIFSQYDMPLPAITRLLVDLSCELRARWWLWIGLGTAAAFAVRGVRKHPAGRRWWDHMLLHAAGVGNITRSLVTARAFQLLGMMIASGVPLLEALTLTRASMNNTLFRELFDQLKRDVLEGTSLAASLRKVDFLPRGAVDMIATAEKTGTLGSVTQIMGEHYEEEGETRLRELITLAEPAIIVVMGVVVACVVLAVMLPIFEFSQMAHTRT